MFQKHKTKQANTLLPGMPTKRKLKAHPDTTNLRSKATYCSEIQTSDKQFN